MKTNTGVFCLTERSEHNHWGECFAEGREHNYCRGLCDRRKFTLIQLIVVCVRKWRQSLEILFDRRNWTQSLESLVCRRKCTQSLENLICQEEVNTFTGVSGLKEGIKHNHWGGRFARRKWTETLEYFIWQKELNTIIGESVLPDGSEHNYLTLLFDRRKWQNHWWIWFARRKWTKSLDSVLWQKEVNTIIGEFCLIKGDEQKHWRFWVGRRKWTQWLEGFFAEANEHNRWSFLVFQKEVDTNTGECYLQKEVNTFTG